MNTATFALSAFAVGALVALESFPGTLVALALAGALVDLALAGALVDLAFVGALVGVAVGAFAGVTVGMDIFNLRDDAGCRPRARACGSMPKYGSNASSLITALANGTAAAKQRMTTAMDSFIAIGWTRAFVDE